MIIAIDGPAGAGKSTVARRVAEELGLTFLDTGAMYRALAWIALQRGLDVHDPLACTRLAEEIDLAFDERGRVLIDGEPGEPAIRSEIVTSAVSPISAHAGVRRTVVARQREMASSWGGLVAEGRDTTTVVFPESEHKFFLVATPSVRARRRALQLGAPEREAEILAEIQRRDELDSTRAHSPLIRAEGAVLIDGDRLDAEGVVRVVLEHVQGERS